VFDNNGNNTHNNNVFVNTMANVKVGIIAINVLGPGTAQKGVRTHLSLSVCLSLSLSRSL